MALSGFVVVLSFCMLTLGQSCAPTCYKATCDFWDGGYWGTCAVLHSNYGCNCAGCECDGCPQGSCDKPKFDPIECPYSGNAGCDESDNHVDCAYDGGDCCEDTCIGSNCPLSLSAYNCRDPDSASHSVRSHTEDVRPYTVLTSPLEATAATTTISLGATAATTTISVGATPLTSVEAAAATTLIFEGTPATTTTFVGAMAGTGLTSAFDEDMQNLSAIKIGNAVVGAGMGTNTTDTGRQANGYLGARGISGASQSCVTAIVFAVLVVVRCS